MKFCFFGHISPALKGKTKGGGELQIYLLAKALAIKGHEVSIIDPYADEPFTTPDGIDLITVPEWKKGLKGFRLFTYRIPALKRAFAKQDADYYYVRMRSYIHLIPYLIAKKQGAKFVQAIASDVDVLSFRDKYKYEYKSSKLLRVLSLFVPNDLAFKYLLKNSDYVALQHTGQRFKLDNQKAKQVIFSNIIDLAQLPPVTQNPTKDYYIYVGSITMLKGADNLFKLINSIREDISVIIVGLPKDEEPGRIYKELGKKNNVILKGHKDHKETIQLIANAKALINTSYYEGFPNIFLEAWATGVPVISLKVNPGNIIDDYRLGICCDGDLNKMKRVIESDETGNINREALTTYVNQYHNSETAAERFLDILNRNSHY